MNARSTILLVLVLLATALFAFTASSAEPAGNAGAVPASVHGLAPLPDEAKVPTTWLPPGALDPDPGPSDVLYPRQSITIRFNHKLHLDRGRGLGLTCDSCHPGGKTSTSPRDHLLPKATFCDTCHGSNHENLNQVEPGTSPNGQCAYCHIGYKTENKNAVIPMDMPRANLNFDHRKHAARNIGCPKCHGSIPELELATRDQLPRMRGCLTCHQRPDAASQGDAKSACETCHLRPARSLTQPGQTKGTDGGRIQTIFASGVLRPPRWLHNAAHTPDFIERHKQVAGNDSEFCGNCHKEEFCADCHDGRVRPRSIHPSDYLSMHAIEARRATQNCQSCHREQSFCLGCHQRAGVSMSGPPDVRNSGRFHPPKSTWSDSPRRPGHHAFEAQRNLNACVSCHIERDCVACHGGAGIGGGFNPHRAGFVGNCAAMFRRNPRPCLVCHEPAAFGPGGSLGACR